MSAPRTRIVPPRLQPGDEIRVIAPSTSLAIVSRPQRRLAEQVLRDLGLNVSYSRHATDHEEDGSPALGSRIADLHTAFADGAVKGILTAIGGYSSNQMLDYLDYEMIAANPKVLCGYSDITALATAIYARTGLVTYSGPHFSSFGMRQGLSYTIEYFQKCLMSAAPFSVPQAPTWSDDPWYRDQDNRVFEPSGGYLVLREGQAEGTLLGGNLCTLNLLQGTPYMPSLEESILLLEDDFEVGAATFDRDLQSLLHLPDADGIRGLVIGRFQRASEIGDDRLRAIITSKRRLDGRPIVAGASFGHTTPHFTFPIGGTGRLSAHADAVELVIEQH